jgi:hypothetical protein
MLDLKTAIETGSISLNRETNRIGFSRKKAFRSDCIQIGWFAYFRSAPLEFNGYIFLLELMIIQ